MVGGEGHGSGGMGRGGGGEVQSKVCTVFHFTRLTDIVLWQRRATRG